MAEHAARAYEFGEFRLDGARRALQRRDGTHVPLTPKALETLTYLVEHAGTVLDKNDLMRAVWPDTAVEENNLNQHISLLRRALGEERGDRRYIATVPGRGYQFVGAVRVTAARAAGVGQTEDASIAVLPFVNLSADPAYDYFGDGIADELITALSRLPRVRVAARTSAFSFKGKQADVREIAAKLGVDLVLEGSLRTSGSRLRIAAQLINATDGCHVWSARYEREMEMRDVFEVQDDITVAVVNALRLTLPGGGTSPVVKRQTESVKAHDLYLQGRFYLFRMTASGIARGVEFFERAIEADPSYALAHVGLAHAYRMYGLSLERATADVGPKAKAAALEAIAIDDTLAEAHAVLAFNLFWFEWAWAAAERHFQRARELNPDSADTHWMYAHLPSNLGRHEAALAAIARARERDPLSGLVHAMEGQFLLHAGRTDDAIARLDEARELDPRSRVAHLFTASACIEKGRFADAVVEARAAHALSPTNTEALALEACAHVKLGARAEAETALQRLRQLAETRHVSPYHVAFVYNALGESADALACLERALEERDPKMVFLDVEPKWRNLRAEPRFVALRRRMDFPG